MRGPGTSTLCGWTLDTLLVSTFLVMLWSRMRMTCLSFPRLKNVVFRILGLTNYARNTTKPRKNKRLKIKQKNFPCTKYYPNSSRLNFLSFLPSLILKYTGKKRFRVFPSPAWMSLTKLYLAENNQSNPSPRKVWSEQIQETRKVFYSVMLSIIIY